MSIEEEWYCAHGYGCRRVPGGGEEIEPEGAVGGSGGGDAPEFDEPPEPDPDEPDVPDYGDPQEPPDEPDPQPQPPAAPPDAAGLEELARRAKLPALNALSHAWNAMGRFLAGTATTGERTAVRRALSRYFPGATRAQEAAIHAVLAQAWEFLNAANFVGVASLADARAAGEFAIRAWQERPQPDAAVHIASGTIFILPGFAMQPGSGLDIIRSVTDMASVLLHEALHAPFEPNPVTHVSEFIDHGQPDPTTGVSGGALDNAFNYQGLASALGGLSISPREEAWIDMHVSP